MQMNPLNIGDLIAIVAPAKAIEQQKIDYAKDYLEKLGFNVWIGPHTIGQHYYFSGTDEERTSDLQAAIDNPDVKAILCARGGYGCIRILDNIDWKNQVEQPKWIIGFSDITVFHQKMDQFGISSIHGTVPLNFQDTSQKSLDSLIDVLTSNSFHYQIESNSNNIIGEARGQLIGGNLSIIYSLIGTDIQPDYHNKILFIEDVGEALYAIDRILYSLDKSQILNQISGLIIGGMTELKDSNPVFGQGIEDIIRYHLSSKKIPVCFHFPAGHQHENWALILGSEVQMSVTKEDVIVKTI